MADLSPRADRAMALALSPILIAQAAWLMARVPKLPEPVGPRTGETGQGPRLRLLIIGDSSGAGVGVETQEHALTGQVLRLLAPRYRVEWYLLAKSGATTGAKLEALRAADLGPLDVAVTALGVNDVKNGVALDEWLDNTMALHAHLETQLNVRQVIVSGLPPLDTFPALPRPLSTVLGRRAARFETALLDEFRRVGSTATYLPLDYELTADNMAHDGFHPGPEVYAEWARRVNRVIGPADGTEPADQG